MQVIGLESSTTSTHNTSLFKPSRRDKELYYTLRKKMNSENEGPLKALADMFPTLEEEIRISVLQQHCGNLDAAITTCLSMTDPTYVDERQQEVNFSSITTRIISNSFERHQQR
jgi:hypothetical protein